MPSKHTHFTYEERLLLLKYVSENKTARDIGRRLMKSPSTISRELQLNAFSKERLLNSDLRCCHYKFCDQRSRDCFNNCLRYERETREARIGPYVSKGGLARINMITKEYVKEKKQPISHVMTHKNLGVSKSSFYRYVERGYLQDIKDIDLPRKVRYKPRIKQYEKLVPSCIKTNRKGRTYADFLNYIENNKNASIVEMNSVVGNIGQSVLLTLLLRESNFMIAFKRNNNDSCSVVKCFDYLKQKLGKVNFLNLFHVILEIEVANLLILN